MSENKAKRLFNSFTNISDSIIEEAQTVKVRKKIPVRKKWGAIAACICLTAIGVIAFILNTSAPNNDDPSFLGCSAEAQIGGIFHGVFYYCHADGSFWRYTVGGTAEYLFSEQVFDRTFTETGVYYTQDLKLFFRPYSGEEPRLLYSSSDPETDQIRFSVQDDGSIVLKLYDLRTAAGSLMSSADQKADSVLIDGKTGETLEILYENIPFEEAIAQVDYGFQSFQIGDRTLTYISEETEGGVSYDIVEDGRSILPEGARTDGTIHRLGDGIMIYVYQNPGSLGSFWRLYLAPDGREINLGNTVFMNDTIGEDGRYLLYLYGGGKLGAYDIETGEKWALEMDSYIKIAYSTTDGTHFYSTNYESNGITLWKLVYDETGKPVGMTILSENICNSSNTVS